MNQNKLLYNIVKIAGSVANQGTNYDYDKLSSGIQQSMAYQYGQQSGKDRRAHQTAYENARRYVREGRMTPDEAQRRLDARQKQNYQFDDRYINAIRDFPLEKYTGFRDTYYNRPAFIKSIERFERPLKRILKRRLGLDKPLI